MLAGFVIVRLISGALTAEGHLVDSIDDQVRLSECFIAAMLLFAAPIGLLAHYTLFADD